MKDGSGVKIGDFGLAYDLETYQRQKKLNQNHINFASKKIFCLINFFYNIF